MAYALGLGRFARLVVDVAITPPPLFIAILVWMVSERIFQWMRILYQ
jgi:hypothetical protein